MIKPPQWTTSGATIITKPVTKFPSFPWSLSLSVKLDTKRLTWSLDHRRNPRQRRGRRHHGQPASAAWTLPRRFLAWIPVPVRQKTVRQFWTFSQPCSPVYIRSNSLVGNTGHVYSPSPFSPHQNEPRKRSRTVMKVLPIRVFYTKHWFTSMSGLV